MADITLDSIDPPEAIIGSTSPITVTFRGTGFTEATELLWNGAEDVFRYVSESEGNTVVEMQLATIASTATVALRQDDVTTPELEFRFVEQGTIPPEPKPEDSASPNTDAEPAVYMSPDPPDVYQQVALPENQRST